MDGAALFETSRLDASTLAAALRSGIYRVIGEQQTLNRINVFPVADGDTGTNLSTSLGAVLDILGEDRPDHAGELLVSLADRLIDSARGNSGAILAQFFQGLADTCTDAPAFATGMAASAFEAGHRYAKAAVSDPQPGTVLSTIAAFAAGYSRAIAAGEIGHAEALQAALDEARDALERTTGQLKALRDAGVVDAGASGFVSLFDGFAEYLISGREPAAPDLEHRVPADGPVMTVGIDGPLAYGFCAECVVVNDVVDRRKLRERLSSLGDSLVLAGSIRKTRVHIHTDDTATVFDAAAEFGQVTGIKADDLRRQQKSAHDTGRRFAVVADSAADIAADLLERLDIHLVPCRVQFGDRSFLDKVSISSADFFAELRQNPVAPTTSQPAPGEFRRCFEFLASHYSDVLSINLTPRLSGTFRAAEAAAARVGAPGRVQVIDSRNASVGQGQIAVYAAECARAGLDAATAAEAVARIIPRTRSFGLIRDLGPAVRGGRVPGWVKAVADFARVTPILGTRPGGGVGTGGFLPGRSRPVPRFARYIARRVRRDAEFHVVIAHADCEADAGLLRSLLEELLPNVTRWSVTPIGAALGAHSGPGSIAVSLQEWIDPSGL